VAKEHGKANGAIAFESAVAKTENEEKVVESGFIVKKTDELRHLVYGVALDVNKVDTQGDFEVPLEVERAAHAYMVRLWKTERPDMIGAQHEYPVDAAVVVESYLAPVDFWFSGTPHDEEHLVKEGSWVLVSLIADDIEFAKVLDGTYTGYSVQGTGSRRKIT